MVSAENTDTKRLRQQRLMLPAGSMLKVPRRSASVVMVHAILDACLIVLREEEAELSPARVASVAGVSPGTLYQYFASKEMLISGVLERTTMTFIQVLEHLMFDPRNSGEAGVQRIVEGACLFVSSSRPAASAAAAAMSPTLWRILADRLCGAVESLIYRYYAMHKEEYGAQATASDVHLAVSGLVFGWLQWLSREPVHISAESLAASSLRMFMSFGTWQPEDARPEQIEPPPPLESQEQLENGSAGG